MTTQYRTKGFVFKKKDRNESDRIFSVFADDFGRLDIFAKAVRKITSKLRPHIDVFYFSELEFIQGKSHKTLTDAVTIKKFNNINKDNKKLKIVYKIADVLDIFLKGQEKDIQIFNLLADFLNKLEDDTLEIKNYQLAYQYFFWNFISLQGYRLEVDNCAVCHSKLNPYNIYFSGREGGAACSECLIADKEAFKINSDIIKVLRIILKKDWHTLSRLKVEPPSQQLLYRISEDAILTFCPS